MYWYSVVSLVKGSILQFESHKRGISIVILQCHQAMLPFCQQCSFLIVLHFYATGSYGAAGHQNTFCTLPREAQHLAASGKPGKDPSGSYQPQSPCCALANRGRPRLPSPLPAESAASCAPRGPRLPDRPRPSPSRTPP